MFTKVPRILQFFVFNMQKMERGEPIMNMQTQEENHHGDMKKIEKGDSIVNMQTQEENHHHGGPGSTVSSTMHSDSRHGIPLCEFAMNHIGNANSSRTELSMQSHLSRRLTTLR
jgi:hypothetical protein